MQSFILQDSQTPLSGGGTHTHGSPASPTATAGRHIRDYVPSGFPGGAIQNGPVSPAAPTFPSGGAEAVRMQSSPSSPDAAEWRAMYGASPEMLAATSAAFHEGCAGVSYMTPIFHLTAHDASILAMEHNNHCKLLAVATSKNEILVTWTQLMPVIENMGALRGAGDDLFGGEVAPAMDERLLEWDPATMSILIDELPFTCTALFWAPWQQGIYLAGLCPGHGLRIYRYSHGHWALGDAIPSADCVSCAISKHFSVACACGKGRVELWVKGEAGNGKAAAPRMTVGESTDGVPGGEASASAWVLRCTLVLPLAEDEDGITAGGAGSARYLDASRPTSTATGASSSNGIGGGGSSGAGGRHRLRDILNVAWDESGSFLAVGDQGGCVYVVAAAQESTQLADVVFQQPASAPSGGCRQVAWAPSSGRSFLSLAMVFPGGVRIVLFRRPPFMSAAGLPQSAYESRRTHTSHSSGCGGRRGSTDAAVPLLQVLASTFVSCDEVAKLSWNGTGTRFVTSHLDSAVNIWAVDVRYQYQSRRVESGAMSEAPEGAGDARGSGNGAGISAHADERLSLTVAVRRTSSVHPYHATAR